ncbi:MAG: class F sortase [Caldilineae bacterium]|nr:class F sortase [Caldilineae bacterium]
MLRWIQTSLLALTLTMSLTGCLAVPETLGIVVRAARGSAAEIAAQQRAETGTAERSDPARVLAAAPATEVAAPTVTSQARPSLAERAVRLLPLASDTPQPTFTPTPTSTPLPTATPLPSPTAPPEPTADPLAAAGRPIRLEIPAIGVDAEVEAVGLTPDRAMDVPKGWMNAGWYQNGFLPGEIGNAVIAGHLDTSTGGPAVFWDLNQLVAGDEIHVTYEDGSRFTFAVEANKVYDHDAEGAIIESIFGKSLTPDLNLVTCDGAWDHGAATYSKRLVVFATIVPGQTVFGSGRANQID